jgi:hypothetical protein
MTTKTANDWREECNYISNTIAHMGETFNPAQRRSILRNFNGDTACFARYCGMQRDDAERNGFYDAALYIQECINDMP